MRFDLEDVSRSFPWVKEMWLFAAAAQSGGQTGNLGLLVVSAIPPREVQPGQRKRLLAQLQHLSDCPLDLRLTTSEQLAKWLGSGGRFASTFRQAAVKLFERPSGAP